MIIVTALHRYLDSLWLGNASLYFLCCKFSGVQASRKMAETDLPSVNKYKFEIESAAEKNGVSAAVLAGAIISTRIIKAFTSTCKPKPERKPH